MKRLGLVLLLVLCLGGVLYLVLETTDAGTERRSAASLAADAARDGDRAADEAGAETGDAAAGARVVDDDPNRVPGPDIRLRGRVLAGDRGVPGAAVSITPGHPPRWQSSTSWWRRQYQDPPRPFATATADAEGWFEIRFPRRTQFVAQASAPGHGFARLWISVPETGDPPEIELRLGDARRMVGRVVTAQREPVPGVPITLSTSDWRITGIAFETTTDAQGAFAFEDLSDGGYRLRAEPEGRPMLTATASLPQRTHVEFVLGDAGAVVGTVLDGKGAALSGATVMVTTTNATTGMGGRGHAQTDAQGAYRIDPVLPGTVQAVIVEHPAVGELSSYRSQVPLPTKSVKAGKELHHDIRLAPGVPVRGKAVLAGSGKPAKGARVALLSLATVGRGLSDVAQTVADEHGSFLFEYVPEGTYALEAFGPFAARRATRWPQPGRPLTIDFYTDGAGAVPQQRVELAATGAVRGRIVGIAPGANTQRTANLQAEGNWISSQVDDLGFFDIRNVPPTAAAIVQTWNPQAKSEPFEVEAGEVAVIEVDPGRKGDFEGVVEDEAGRPVPGAALKVIAEPRLAQDLTQFAGGQTWGAVRAGPDGRFVASAEDWQRQNYRSNKWAVVAFHPAYVLGIVTGLKMPQEGQTTAARIVLGSGGTVSGRVVFGGGGGPASGLLVTLAPKRDKTKPFETRGTRRAYTRFDGSFEVVGVAEGLYVASVYYADGKADTRDAAAGDKGLLFEIRPTEFIAGVVLDADQKPVTQGQIYAIVPGATKEEKRFGSLAAGGRFRINHLEPGSYAIEVAPPRNRNYGGATTHFETTRIPPVQTGREDVVIEIPPGPSIEGKVVDSDNRPVVGAGVVAMPLALKPAERNNSWNISRPSGVTNGRGEFKIKNVGKEQVELIAVAIGHRPATAKAMPGAAGVRLRLEPGEVIEGRLLHEDGTPVTNQWLNLQPASPEIQKKTQDWQMRGGQTWGNLGGWQLTSTSTNARGEFRFEGLFPGEWRLQLQVDDGVLPPRALRTGAGPVVLRLEAALSIRGRVLDPDGNPPVPAKNQQIWVNAQVGGQNLRGATADADGYFEIKGLPRGEVTLRVWAGQQYKYLPYQATAGDQGVVLRLEFKAPANKEKKSR